MDIGGTGLLLVIALIALAAVGGAVWWRGRGEPAPPPPATPVRQEPVGLAQTLGSLQASSRWSELLRLLDQSLPEWPVSSSLIEVARAVAALDRDLGAVRGTAVSDVVTSRLTEQAQTVSDGLWNLADRLVVAGRLSLAPSREQLQREDAVLLQLLPAIREAQSGLVELTLVGVGGDELSRAEGRFLALAATARELQELGPPPNLR